MRAYGVVRKPQPSQRELTFTVPCDFEVNIKSIDLNQEAQNHRATERPSNHILSQQAVPPLHVSKEEKSSSPHRRFTIFNERPLSSISHNRSNLNDSISSLGSTMKKKIFQEAPANPNKDSVNENFNTPVKMLDGGKISGSPLQFQNNPEREGMNNALRQFVLRQAGNAPRHKIFAQERQAFPFEMQMESNQVRDLGCCGDLQLSDQSSFSNQQKRDHQNIPPPMTFTVIDNHQNSRSREESSLSRKKRIFEEFPAARQREVILEEQSNWGESKAESKVKGSLPPLKKQSRLLKIQVYQLCNIPPFQF